MAKKPSKPAVSVLSLNDISGYSYTEAADEYAGRYQARTRAFVEMGKLIYHIEHRANLPKSQTIYGLFRKRDVPEGSINNARQVSKFIENFIATGLVSESRADEIITFRVVNQCARIIEGKSAATMTAADLAPLLNDGDKAAIGDELDCIDEHGVTIADHKQAEEQKRAEQARVAAAAEAAAKLPPVANVAGTTSPSETPEPETVVVDGTKPETPAAQTPAAPQAATVTPMPAPSQSSHGTRPASTAEVLAKIGEVELQSYDLDSAGLQAVSAKLAEWKELIDSSIAAAKKSEHEAAQAAA